MTQVMEPKAARQPGDAVDEWPPGVAPEVAAVQRPSVGVGEGQGVSLAAEQLRARWVLGEVRAQGIDGSLVQPERGIDSGKSVLTSGEVPVGGRNRILKVSAVQPGRFDAGEAKALEDSVAMPGPAQVKKGDILITRSNTPDRVGYCARATEVPQGTYMPDLIWRLRLDEGRCDPDYFEQAMASSEMRNRVTATASGTSASMRKINKKGLSSVPFPLPCLSVQRSYADSCLGIASVGSALDEESRALRGARARLVADLLLGIVAIPESYDASLADAL